jgi:single-strand DNA-binding protein
MNTITLKGNLTRDAEVKSTQTGKTVINLGLAVNRRKKVGDTWKDDPHFFDITYWPSEKPEGNIQREVAKLSKGKQVIFDAHPEQQRWEKDGQSHSKVVFVVEGWVNVVEFQRKDDLPDSPTSGGATQDGESEYPPF